MAKRTESAEKPARKQHRVRSGCLVVLGVSLLVIVSTAFAPDWLPDATATVLPSSTVTRTPSTMRTITHTVFTPAASTTLKAADERTMMPTVSRAQATHTLTESADAVQSTTSTPVQIEAMETPLPATPTRTPTIALPLATNTPFPLLLVTNTPASPES